MVTLASKYPQLAQEWDYKMNGDFTPDSVTPGSHLSVYWKCPKCGQSYKMRISNRTAPSRQNKKTQSCPICLGRVIIPGHNSLKAKYPDIVDKEWDYELNNVDPDTIAPHNGKSYYWKCLNGHESYLARVNNKTYGNGGNCPKCSHQSFSKEFSLKSINPVLALEWDTEHNNGKTADDVFANSNKAYWWKCSKCGYQWKAKVNNRNNGRGCPNCAKGQHTSFPEQVIFHYVRAVFPEAINGYKFHRKELDIYIPSIKTGIEYDGEAFHRTSRKVKFDIAKTQFFKEQGIRIIRIRESRCSPFTSDAAEVLTINYSPDYSDLQHTLQMLIDELCLFSRVQEIPRVDIDAVRNSIMAELHTIPYEESFAAQQNEKKQKGEKVIALWDDERNAPLTPQKVRPFSESKVFWVCPNNSEHRWLNTVKSISLGYGCPFCSKCHRWTTEDWIRKAQTIHNFKFDYSKVVYVNSKTPVEIICSKHGPYMQLPSEHLSGKGCKYCAHQAFHPKESLATVCPEVAKQWDYGKNSDTGYTPDSIGIDSKVKFWWHCTNGKSHSFRATIAQRVKRGSKCAVCHGKQIAYDRSLEANYPELAKEWCPENSKMPSEVSCGSEYKAKWKCPNQDHPVYEASVYNRAHLKSGCPLCARERTLLSRRKKDSG